MSGSGRKRSSSKWDSRDQSQFDGEHIQDDDWPEKVGRSYYHREAEHGGWQSPEIAGSNGSKHDATLPSREPFSGSRGSHKNDNRYLEDSMVWEEDGDYGARMSPGLDEWRQSRSLSPKSGWTRRDRSRSRSRSRGRSRSPGLSLRRESGFLDRNRGRSGVSNQLCKDFTAGRCRRGNNCSFLHDADDSYDTYWDNNSRPRKGGSSKYSAIDSRDYAQRRPSLPCNDFAKGRCRRGASCRFEHHQIASDEFGKANEVSREKENDRRKRDVSMERVVEHEFRRSSDIPCKFFAAGNCRNGKHCRFSHHTHPYSSPDRKLQDKWSLGRRSDDVVGQAWDGPKWNDKAILSDAGKVSAEFNEKDGAIDATSASWSMNDRLRNSMKSESSTIVASAVSSEATKSNNKEPSQWKADGAGSRHGEKWIEDMDMSPDWNFTVSSSNHGQIPQRAEAFKDVSIKNGKHNVIQDSNRLNPIPFFQAKPDLRDSNSTALPFDDNKSTVRKSLSSRTDLNIPANNNMPTVSVTQNCQNASVFPFSSTSKVEQSLATTSSEAQGGILGNLQSNLHSLEGKSVLKPDFQDGKITQVNLTTLSASLVHLLGNGQQLPQLYAALSSNNPTSKPSFGSAEGSDVPVSSSITLPEPVGGLNNFPSVIPPNPVMKTTVSDVKPEIQPNNLNSSSFQPLDDPLAEESIRKTQTLTSPKPSEVGKGKHELGGSVETKQALEESKKVEESDPLDGVEKEGVADGKKSKDGKATRAFKFALVEFVKELLKPSWKDGQINKDVYKTIVKKVVDKVMATVQVANIPQTQEKIDAYLSNAKEKLTKLVQAYVDKNQKS